MPLDLKKTAFLSLDFQKGILASAPHSAPAVACASRALAFARKKQDLVIHVGLGFLQGHPEIPDFPSPFLRVKQNNLFVKESPSAEFHEAILQPGELVVYKQRVGAFSENDLDMILRAQGIRNVVLFGVATSGIVLSTLRRAFDLDYQCVVLQDACFDPDDEVHRVLSEKVFPRQALVTTVDGFLSDQPE